MPRMFRVRLFSSQQPVGFLSLDETGHRLRPEGLLGSDSVDLIRQHLKRGHLAGLIGPYRWYRQATAFCPLEGSRPCPCDDPTCRADGSF